jgi:hypothetical protein
VKGSGERRWSSSMRSSMEIGVLIRFLVRKELEGDSGEL